METSGSEPEFKTKLKAKHRRKIKKYLKKARATERKRNIRKQDVINAILDWEEEMEIPFDKKELEEKSLDDLIEILDFILDEVERLI